MLPIRNWRRSVVSCLAVSVLACGQPEAVRPRLSASASGRNLILISVDTLRADRLGASGYHVKGKSLSPKIDSLLASGVHFSNAIAPRAITWPSLATVLTGLYPSGHGAFENGYQLTEGIPTLPTILQDHGYQAGNFMSNMCRAQRLGWTESFCTDAADRNIQPAVEEWLDEIDPGQPFFLWVHYFGGHSPYYNGGNRAIKWLDPGYKGPVAPKKGMLNRIMTDEIALDEADIHHLDAVYDAAVMGADRYAGQLLDALRERQHLEDSLIVFLADHGEDLYDHNQYIYHACSVYQTGLHVPLAIAAPGLLAEGVVIEENVELVDVAPTILDLLGVPAPGTVHGSSLVPLLERPGRSGRRPAFSEFPPSNMHTVQLGDWKLVDNPDSYWPVCLTDAPEEHYPIERVELYNLAEDPLETRNVADQYPNKVAELQLLIERRFADLPTDLAPQELPEDLREELEALGYVAN